MTEYEERIKDELISFYANETTCFSDEANAIASSYESEWYKLPCSPEGATTEEDKVMDEFLLDVVDEIMDLDVIWNKKFQFNYLKKVQNKMSSCVGEGYDLNGTFVEYDGFIEYAPDEQTAWDLFLSYSGAFGVPDAGDYECVLINE